MKKNTQIAVMLLIFASVLEILRSLTFINEALRTIYNLVNISLVPIAILYLSITLYRNNLKMDR